MRSLYLVAVGLVIAGCSSADGAGPPEDTDTEIDSGSTGTGGKVGTGGATGTGGKVGTGGATGSGGKSGTGGATGSGGSDAGIVVRACSGLGAVDQWENISPPEFRVPSNMETLSVVVDPKAQTVYAAAGPAAGSAGSHTGVMKSTDCGATWAPATTGQNMDRLKTGGQWAMLIDPVDPQTLYVANGYGNEPTIYKSTNGGVDFEGLAPYPGRGTNVFVQGMALEQTDPQHLVVDFHENCASPYTPLCFSQSTDGGGTWQMFNGPASLGGWHEGATLSVLGPSSYVYGGDGGFYTGNNGQTWTKVVNDVFNAAYPGSTDIAPDGTIYLTGSGSVYSSHTNPIGSSWTAIPNSPRASVIIDDGVRLFASYAWGGPQPNWTAPLSNPSAWTPMTSPSMSRGGNELAYDAVHHIVYSANWGAGLWRVVTR
jgi:hypothetical protein